MTGRSRDGWGAGRCAANPDGSESPHSLAEKKLRSQLKLGHILHAFFLIILLSYLLSYVGFSPALLPTLLDSPQFWTGMVASCTEHLLGRLALFPFHLSLLCSTRAPLSSGWNLSPNLSIHLIAPPYSRIQHIWWQRPGPSFFCYNDPVFLSLSLGMQDSNSPSYLIFKSLPFRNLCPLVWWPKQKRV